MNDHRFYNVSKKVYCNELARVIAATKKLLRAKKSWTKNVMARGKGGVREVAFDSDRATCFCLQGAICRAVGDLNSFVRVSDAFGAVERQLRRDRKPNSLLSYFNDDVTTTHADVVGALGKTIAHLRKGSI
jgi:hypothetical protein